MLRFALKSVVYFWPSSVCMVLGCALGCAVLTGSLIMGTSVRHTLVRSAARRLGEIDYTVGRGDRLFPETLGERAGLATASVLQTQGVVIVNPPSGRAFEIPGIQVLGVDQRFAAFAESAPAVDPAGVLVNPALAERLGDPLPDALSVRVPLVTRLPREAPLAQGGDRQTARFRAAVSGILGPDQLGNFNLAPEQRPVPTIFVPLDRLQQARECDGRVNLLIGREQEGVPPTAALERVLKPEDYGLLIRRFPDLGRMTVTSETIFLDPAVAKALAALPGGERQLTYLVNGISLEKNGRRRSTPYSFVTAGGTDAPLINSWLAEQLNAAPGDRLEISYYVMDPGGGFRHADATLAVGAVEPVATWAAERALVPEFPGLTNVESCAAWDIGLPMDPQALEDKPNEAYWDTFGPTPKLRVPYALGKKLWATKYGDTTAFQFPLDDTSEGAIRAALRNQIRPGDVGLDIRQVRQDAQTAVNNALDFGQLFTGMSFFIVVSSLLLVGLMTAFSLEKRFRETGVLGAVGFTRGAIRGQLLGEVFLLLVPGALLGLLLGPAYAKALILCVNGYWQGAVAQADIYYAASPSVFFIGFSAVVGLGFLVAGGVIWHHSGSAVVELIKGGCFSASPATATRRSRWLFVTGLSALVGAGIIEAVAGVLTPDAMTGPFFGAGVLMLAGFSMLLLSSLRLHGSGRWLQRGTFGLVLGGLSRRPLRTTLVVFLTATGCFLVFAVAGMSKNVTRNADVRSSGTGGFELFARAAMPVLPTRTAENPGGSFFTDPHVDNLETVVPLRVYAGADASCLNLNAVPNPGIYGVDPAVVERLGAFVATPSPFSVWNRLNMELAEDGVPLIPALAGDIDTAVWGLRMKAHPKKGGILTYTRQDGTSVRIKLVGRLPQRLTVFQGGILISAVNFANAFPEADGFRAFLFDTPPAKIDSTARQLRQKYGVAGLDVIPAVDRLQTFYTVEATYLQMFLVLGGMGVMLGMAGLGIVTLRNILERHREFALMQATGFSRSHIHAIVVREALITLGLGLLFGGLSAVIAVMPGLVSGATRPPLAIMLPVSSAILANGLIWASLAAHRVIKTPLLPALRSE